MKLLQKILEITKFNKARREGEARLLDTLVASGIIALVTAVNGSLNVSTKGMVFLLLSVIVGWLIRQWLRKE